MPRARRERPPCVPDEVLRRLRVSFIRRATLVVDGREEPVTTVDLGLRGIFVERLAEVPAGAPLAVRFRLPGNEREIEARGRVAWRQPPRPRQPGRLPPGVGLEFVDIDADGQERLRAFMAEHYRRGPKARQFVRPWPDETA